MHELAITMNILSIALDQARKARAIRIRRINLTIGTLSGIVPEYVKLQFDMISKETIAAGASLSFFQPPTKLRCRNCDSVFSSESRNWICPRCGEERIEILSGQECYIDHMEVE